MFIEVQAAYFVLKRWNRKPVATKRQIGIWQHWKEQTLDNDRPLTKVEVEKNEDIPQAKCPDQLFHDIRKR